MINSIPPLNRSMEKTHNWLIEIKNEGHFENEMESYQALRAVLHVLRDRLTTEEVCHFGSELPMIVRGMFYEGWRPNSHLKIHTAKEFIKQVHDLLANSSTIDGAHATNVIFKFLQHKISQGEMRDIKAQFSEDLRKLFN